MPRRIAQRIAAFGSLLLFTTAAARAEEAVETPAPVLPPKPVIERTAPGEYRLGGIDFRRDTKRITFPAKINMVGEKIEYAIVHENGKIHESLLSTKVNPYHLQVVLLLCGYTPGLGTLFDAFAREGGPGNAPEAAAPGKEQRSSTRAPDSLVIRVAWESESRPEEHRLEDLIHDATRRAPMERGPWAYTGSAIVGTDFQSEVEGSIAAVYLDDLAMINHPGQGNTNDDNWTPRTDVLPPMNTPVTVTIEPPAAAADGKAN